MAKFLVIVLVAILIIGLDGAPAVGPKTARSKRYVVVREGNIDAGAANQVRHPRAAGIDVNAAGLLEGLGLGPPGRIFIARDTMGPYGGSAFFSNANAFNEQDAEFETLSSPVAFRSNTGFVSPRFFRPEILSVNV